MAAENRVLFEWLEIVWINFWIANGKYSLKTAGEYLPFKIERVLLVLLPVEQRVEYKIALIVFKCLNTEDFPSYLKDLIQVYTPSRSLRSADKLLLTKPITKLKIGERSFCYSAPVVWNKLPFGLRSCTRLPTFKKTS